MIFCRLVACPQVFPQACLEASAGFFNKHLGSNPSSVLSLELTLANGSKAQVGLENESKRGLRAWFLQQLD